MCFPGSSNVGDTLPTGQLSNIPWRRAGVKYTNNEAYFDVIEEIDAILDKSGTINHIFITEILDMNWILLVLKHAHISVDLSVLRHNSICRDPGCN